MVKILLLPTLILSIVKAAIPFAVEEGMITSFLCAPLNYSQTSKMLLEVKAQKRTPIDVSIKIYNAIYPLGKELFASTFNTYKNVVINYENEYTYVENKIEVVYTTHKGKIVSSKKHEVPLIKSEYVNINENKVTDKIPCSAFSLAKGWYNAYATYTFDGFEDLYIPTFYHKIDFSEFKIHIPETFYDAFSADGELVIENYNAKYFNEDNDKNYSSIPLKVVKDKNFFIHFEPAIPLYVDMNTLEMSFTKHDDYVQTKHFYLPTNKYFSQNKYSFHYVFKNFGLNKSNLTHTFKFNALINSIGDCISSEYCVIRS